MECLKFTIKSPTAFFKKNDINNVYFSYNNIHKVAIRGLLGAIIGLPGYNQTNGKGLPQFYTELKDIKVGIVPKKMFNKKIITFTNTTGFANCGDNLIVKQQWLFDVEWDVYLLNNENKHYKTIKSYILNNMTEFIPYLGANDHQADILNPEIIECELLENEEDYIDSLFITDENSENNIPDYSDDVDNPIYFKEIMPIDLLEKVGYVKQEVRFTNCIVTNIENVYNCEGKNIYFL